MSINDIILLLLNNNAQCTNATALAAEYKIALKSNDFAVMQDVLEHAHELLALYS